MTAKTFAKTVLTAATLAAAFATGYAQAGTVPADHYGYNFRTGERSAFVDGARGNGPRNPFVDGARAGERNAFVDGARAGKVDPYTDGARIVAGLDRTGVSATPQRSVDPYTDGARAGGKFDPFTDGARQRDFDVFTQGARA